MRFDRNACGKKVLDAIATGQIGLEVFDFTDVYNMESSFMVSDYLAIKSHAQLLA